MVSRDSDSHFDVPKPPVAGGQSGDRKPFQVMVPVFLKVSLMAEDDLAAEVEATQLVRQIEIATPPGEEWSIKIASVIAPIPVNHSGS